MGRVKLLALIAIGIVAAGIAYFVVPQFRALVNRAIQPIAVRIGIKPEYPGLEIAPEIATLVEDRGWAKVYDMKPLTWYEFVPIYKKLYTRYEKSLGPIPYWGINAYEAVKVFAEAWDEMVFEIMKKNKLDPTKWSGYLTISPDVGADKWTRLEICYALKRPYRAYYTAYFMSEFLPEYLCWKAYYRHGCGWTNRGSDYYGFVEELICHNVTTTVTTVSLLPYYFNTTGNVFLLAIAGYGDNGYWIRVYVWKHNRDRSLAEKAVKEASKILYDLGRRKMLFIYINPPNPDHLYVIADLYRIEMYMRLYKPHIHYAVVYAGQFYRLFAKTYLKMVKVTYIDFRKHPTGMAVVIFFNHRISWLDYNFLYSGGVEERAYNAGW